MKHSPREYSPERLESLSLARLKELRSRRVKAHRHTHAPLLDKQERGPVLPLSYTQERLWFSEQLGLVGPAYNMSVTLNLDGQLHVPALEQSIQDLSRRHESLRTRFESTGGAAAQIIEPPGSFALAVLDLEPFEPNARETELQRLIAAESAHPFDLKRGPVIRGLLIRVRDLRHVLLITLHHIVSDGWSLEVINRELGSLYSAYAQGQSPSLPELAIQYVDYAIWQRQRLQGERLHGHLRYWKEQLAGAPPLLELPTDHPHPATASFKGNTLSFELPPRLCARLEDIAREEGATLFMVMLAAFQLLLARYSGQQDIVVGTPIAGRTDRKTEGLIGFFVNMLPLRTDLSGHPTFRQLVNRVKQVTLGAYAHQELPFEKLVMEVRPERNLAHQPIFQVTLALHNFPQEPLELPGLTWTRVDAEQTTTLFDLSLHLYERPHGRLAVLEYSLDLFERPTIERMTQSLQVLLEDIVERPDHPATQLQLLTVAEREQLLYGLNQTGSDYPRDRLTHELFEAQTQRTPDAIAITYQDRSLTYKELNQRANQLARHMTQQGVTAGEYVPILLPRCLTLVIAQIAVLKAGAVYVPLDPELPAERLAYMIKDCRAQLIVTEGTAHPIHQTLAPAQWLDCTTQAPNIAALDVSDLNLTQNTSESPAYLMYTSGSTGTPKGVIIPHRAINRLVINNDYAKVNPTDCIAYCSNPAFDASTFEVWGALLTGARALILPQSVVLEPTAFVAALRQERVTAMFLTIGLFTQYVDALRPILGQFRYLLTGGDVVEPRIASQVLNGTSPMEFRNAYGPTECTTFSTTYKIGAVEEGAKTIPIGRPISNTEVYILDDDLQPVPLGVTGEIHIGGPGVALGYLNRPELTTQRFIPNPFSRNPGGKLYRTGDLAYWRPDGNLEFVGRNDTQIKIRGFRIELGEIEAQLLRHPHVKETTVLVRRRAPGDKSLVAYIVPRDSEETTPRPSPQALTAYLKNALPEHMVPHAFVMIERLPPTSNGKVDRKALPDPDLTSYSTRHYDPPEGDVEKKLSEIWQTLLGIEKIGRADNFFELGGHSLLGMKLVADIAAAFTVHLPAVTVFRCPTIQLMATTIEQLRSPEAPLSKTAAIEFEEGHL